MSNISLVIEERAREIGSFLVGRLLPFSQKRMVGPFIYIDHMGPTALSAEENLDVPPHPHIGLSTLTYLLEGSIMHRDSMGTVQEIEAGAVNWMTAGSGIVHSERTPERLRQQSKRLHGLQIWVALPKHLEEMAPSFTHISADAIPSWMFNGVSFRLLAGRFEGHVSPVPVHSDLFLIELWSELGSTVDLAGRLFGEAALYVIEGEVQLEGASFAERQLLVAKDASLCAFELRANSRVYIFGGMPFEEQRYIDWNFVASDPARLTAAREAWQAGRFTEVPGEHDAIVMPDLPKSMRYK